MSSGRHNKNESKEQSKINPQFSVKEFPYCTTTDSYPHPLQKTQLLQLPNSNLVVCYNYSDVMQQLALVQLWKTSGEPSLISSNKTSTVTGITAISETMFATNHDYDDGISIWDSETGVKKGTMPKGSDLGHLLKLTNGLFVKHTGWGLLEIFDFNKSLAEPIAILKPDSDSSDQRIKSLIEISDNRLVALFWDDEIRIWDTNNFKPLLNFKTFDNLRSKLHHLSSGYFAQDDGSAQGKIDILNASVGCIGSYHLKPPFSFSSLFKRKAKDGFYDNNTTVLPNGNIFAIYQSDSYQSIGVLDTNSNIKQCKWLWQKQIELEDHMYTDRIVLHTSLPSGHVVLVHPWGKLTVVNTESGELEVIRSPEKVYDSRSSPMSVRCFAILADGRLVFSENEMLHFYDLPCIREYFNKIKMDMENSTKLFPSLLNIVGEYTGYSPKLFSSSSLANQQDIEIDNSSLSHGKR